MDYSDDGVTLNYDILKGKYPKNDVFLKSSKPGGPKKVPFAGYIYWDRKRIRKYTNYQKSMDSFFNVPETLKSLITPEPESNDIKLEEKQSEILAESTSVPAPPEQKILKESKKIGKRPGRPGKKKRQGSGSMMIKRPRKIVKRPKVESESTKDNSNGSIKSEGEAENISKKEEIEPKNQEVQENKKIKALEKQKQDELAIQVKKRSERPLFELDDRSRPGYLLNPIPKFSNNMDKSLKIYDINKLFSFDPLRMGQ